MKSHLCPKCLKAYKKSYTGVKERKALKAGNPAQWGSQSWPDWVYHYEDTRLCAKHAEDSLHQGAKRRAKKLNACPDWADQEKILAVYKEAKRIQRETGQKVHVDHIVPLQGKTVSGLHIHTNLQILPAQENIKKGNRIAGAHG